MSGDLRRPSLGPRESVDRRDLEAADPEIARELREPKIEP